VDPAARGRGEKRAEEVHGRNINGGLGSSTKMKYGTEANGRKKAWSRSAVQDKSENSDPLVLGRVWALMRKSINWKNIGSGARPEEKNACCSSTKKWNKRADKKLLDQENFM